ncbi:DMT family transporter [Arcobacter roscoffensis]|uniref:DMT family transporter n=1 Tax=Arcobacter roscoffensis TaxID=2961520 RepID=A0ABY5E9R9_9BACT|nr:DMT family transporter [Arcobacter roscoffensis]UTJ07833.1 DMT family transporter [Arcobacter roscoffensis]
MNQNIQAHILVFTATILVALSFIISGKLSGIIDPISLTLGRFVLAFISLLPIILIVKKYRVKIKKSFIKGLKISFFYSLYFILLFKALEDTTALNTATLFTLVPLITAILANFIFKDKLNILKLFIYFMGMIGTTIVIFDGDIQRLINLSFNNGDIIFLFGVLSMALYSISAKFFYEKEDEVLSITLMTLFGGIIWMSIALVALDIPLQWEKLEGENFWYMVYLSIGATLITVFLYQKSTVILGPNKLMAYVYLNPAIVAFLMYIMENQKININTFFGILLSIFATIILLKKSKEIK